ncbi:hypothetical protein WICPIJ_010080 [Wickerhamomyces pijperi]|uniref:TOG domain-containing protein n=1 Tax=Wickerhamomyces pijperi TaxID=599730 RepID=A0A9P8TAA8_WICPI|nr:hypothetical protein WICPIJ_010080 [Wickerhamomyces pijperi]
MKYRYEGGASHDTLLSNPPSQAPSLSVKITDFKLLVCSIGLRIGFSRGGICTNMMKDRLIEFNMPKLEDISTDLEKDLFLSSFKSSKSTLDNLQHFVQKDDVEDADLVKILNLLLKNYDKLFRTELIVRSNSLITEVLAKNTKFIAPILEKLNKLTSTFSTVSIDDLHILNHWVNLIVARFNSADFPLSTAISIHLNLLANVYNQKLDHESQHTLRIRASLLKSSFKSYSKLTEDQVSAAVKQITTDKKASIDAVVAIISFVSEEHQLAAADVELITNWYLTTVLASKAELKNLDSLKTFFVKFISQETFDSKYITAYEKAIIRSSESSLNVISFAFDNTSQHLNLVKSIINSKLLSQFITSFKSSKETVRSLALKAFLAALKSKSAEESELVKIVDELLKSLKTVSNADHKVLFNQTLANVSVEYASSVSLNIVKGLSPLVAKDQNEVSLNEALLAFFTHVFAVIKTTDNILADLTTTITKGFKDAKLQLRKLWFENFGAQLSSSLTAEQLQFIKTLLPVALAASDDVMSNPTKNINAITIPYVVLKLADITGSPSDVFQKALTDSEKVPSVLSNFRVYSKFTTDVERLWFVRALRATSRHSTEVSVDFGKALVTFALVKTADFKVLHENLEALTFAYQNNQKVIGDSIVLALFDIILNNYNVPDTEEKIFDFQFDRINSVFCSLFENVSVLDQEILVEQLCKLAVVAHHDSFTLNWVSLALKTNLDPGYIVKTNDTLIFNDIVSLLETCPEAVHRSGLFSAATRAIATLAFIEPVAISKLIKTLISDDLSVAPLSSITHTDIEIWNAKDGELVVNVLEPNTKKNAAAAADKGSKDYATRKWEEDLKKELSAKKTVAKKLTKEEQALVNEQLSKEAEIRQRVQLAHNKLRRSVGVIDSLAGFADIDNGKSNWVGVAVKNLLEVIALEQTTALVGELPTVAFLNLSKICSGKLGPVLSRFIGVATLRVQKIGVLSEELKQEDILDLISRILFRIKFLSGQQPFDLYTLVYFLPLLSNVLEQGKAVAIINSKKPVSNSEFVEEDKEEEQLLLTVEIISNHAEEFKNTAIPREQIINVLLSLLSLPSKAKLAKDCLLTLCQYISIDFSQSDLSVIFKGLLSSDVFVRNTVLEALDQEFDLTDLKYNDEIWIACHDNDEVNAELGLTIWEENKFELSGESIRSLYNFLGQTDGGLRLSAAKATARAIFTVAKETELFNQVVNELLQLYSEKARPPEPILDEFGLIVKSSQEQKDTWEPRSGIAIVLKLVADLFVDQELVAQFVKFIIESKALGDRESTVAEEFKEAAIAIIDSHGKENVEVLIPVFEAALVPKRSVDPSDEIIRENIVVLYGSLAKHLASSDPRLSTITDRLLKTLETPSEKVQSAISEVIAPLVPLFKTKVGTYMQQLFKALFDAPTVSRRRGAAHGIAGLAKGYGVASLSEFDIIRNLSDAADDKKDPKRREAVSVAFECLSISLGKFFEPYVIEIIPILLKSLGDAVPEVRDATARAAKVIMGKATGYGVKKLIPLAIENLDEISWRSKKGSVELLGSMAYLDPTQLSASLSIIVPEIVGVLNDSHKEVRKAADQSLKNFGDVIRNPEIQQLVPTLIKAIGDPTKHTEDALDALIKTQFVHYIDGPSLALIIHVIHRGMKDRSANTKRKACQIVGNMAILVDTKDLLQYLAQLIAELEIAMVDPVPNTRATAARALGALVEKLGEEQFPDLIPRLIDTLGDESKAGDRLGSAQALSEVISGIGIRKLDELLPTILSGATSHRASTREGFLPLLLFLPVCFGAQFAPYISQIIPAILNGLADTDESIRGTALKAGRLLVKNYATKAVNLLLPELEKGLLDANFRIRLSSVELTGELLFQITGISGKAELEEESEFSNNVNAQLIEILGEERRDKVLSLLFVCRSDTSVLVRNAAIDIWKSLVANTARTVKEILPSLVTIIARSLASQDEVQRTIAAHTLGELVRRAGANSMAQILPSLQESAHTSDADAKQGVCIAIKELIESTSHDTVENYQEIFVDVLRTTLVDSSPSVREAAANAFDSFQDVIGKTAVDEIIPYLLNLLESSDSESALSALEEIMTMKSEVIFPILIPTLLASPIDAFRARALGSMAQVAGKALYKRLSTVINTLVDELINNTDKEADEELKSSFNKILLSVEDDGLHVLLQQLVALIRNEDSKKRAVAYERLGPFFAETNLDYTNYTQDIVNECIYAMEDKDPNVVKNAITALTALVKQQSKDTLERLVKSSKQALSTTGVAGEDLYGFTLPKGPNAILPIFLHGLMYGTPDLRESSALAIADVVSKTPATALKPLVTLVTGPLIRVIGERFNSDIKAAILYALNILFQKIPQFLRPFIPQLQRTFVKSLSDASNETLRLRAAKALGTLIEYQPRVDPLVTELVTGVKTAETPGVKTAMLKAILEVVLKAGEKLNESSKTSILTLVEEEMLEADEKLAVAYARLVGALSRILTNDEAENILKAKVIDQLSSDDTARFAILTLSSFLKDSPAHIFKTGLLPSIVSTLVEGANSTTAYINDNTTTAIGKLLLLEGQTSSPFTKNTPSDVIFEIPGDLQTELVQQLATLTLKPASTSLDSRRLSLAVIRTVARHNPELFEKHYNIIAPSVFACVRDPVIPIKLAAEKAYLGVFNLVEDEKMDVFTKWFESLNGAATIDTIIGTTLQTRSIGDYTKRVAVRLASVERERIAAGGDAETLYSDRIEDENEIWAVGGVDLAKF